MVLRLPVLAEKLRRNDFFFNPLEAEIVAEKASSLGHHARQVEKALAALKAQEGTADERQELLRRAAHEVWAFLAPKIIGGDGLPAVAGPGVTFAADAWQLRDVHIERLGDDILVRGYAGDWEPMVSDE
mgnify:CR=1 FL=1